MYGLRRLSIKSFGLVKKGKYLKAFEDYIICIFGFYTGLLRLLMKRLSGHAILIPTAEEYRIQTG